MIRKSSKLGGEVWAIFLKERGLRLTMERDTIYKAIVEIKGHFTPDMLRDVIHTQMKTHISRATIYSVLKLLMDARLVVQHQIKGNTEYEYAERAYNHYHRICLDCGMVKEATAETFTEAVHQLRPQGFYTLYYSLYLYGICAGCRRRNYRKKAKEAIEQKNK
jgi:Fur family ferric uptake transcriptional regulator